MRIPGRRFLVPALLVLSIATSPVRAADTGSSKDIASTPQAKAYQTLLKAVAAGDFEGYKKSMTKASSKGIDQQMKDMGMDSKKAMSFLKEMTPKDLKYTSLKVDNQKATLGATGKVAGEVNRGTIELEQEDGQWKVANQSWTNAK